MSAWKVKVHYDRDGLARCGHPQARETASDREQVTRPSGYQWPDVKPCGTPAAYRRHLRRQGKPVRCESCLQAERRRYDAIQAARKRQLSRAA